MRTKSLHILYEHAWDMVPFGSAQIRLLRPLSHPQISANFLGFADSEYYGSPVDAIVIDRLWRPDISYNMAKSIVNDIRRCNAKFIYSFDDNFLDMPLHHGGWLTKEKKSIIEFFTNEADQVWVTTQALKDRISSYTSRAVILQNCIDERLVKQAPETEKETGKKITIGYMGTYTHDEDLRMIAEALVNILKRFRLQVELQVLGVTLKDETAALFSSLPVSFVRAPTEFVEYTKFLPWYSQKFKWDIAVSPLKSTTFNTCKSDIKFLDYAIVGAAGIFSNVPAYQNTVQHKQTGLLVDNEVQSWEAALTSLIEDETLRTNIGSKAQTYALTERTISSCAGQWINALSSLLQNQA